MTTPTLGLSHGRTFTNELLPIISGNATPGATITVGYHTIEPLTLGPVTTDNKGNWSIQSTTALPNGVYPFTATITTTDSVATSQPFVLTVSK